MQGVEEEEDQLRNFVLFARIKLQRFPNSSDGNDITGIKTMQTPTHNIDYMHDVQELGGKWQSVPMALVLFSSQDTLKPPYIIIRNNMEDLILLVHTVRYR